MGISVGDVIRKMVGLDEGVPKALASQFRTAVSPEALSIYRECAVDTILGNRGCLFAAVFREGVKEKRVNTWYRHELKRLANHYNFTRIERYSPAMLRSLIRNRLLANYMPLYDKRPLAVVTAAEADHNGAIDRTLNKDFFPLTLAYRTMYYEVGRDVDLINSFLEASDAQSASLFYMFGHGTAFSATLSRPVGSLGRAQIFLVNHGIDPRLSGILSVPSPHRTMRGRLSLFPNNRLLDTSDLPMMKKICGRMVEGGHIYTAACSAATGGSTSSSFVQGFSFMCRKQFHHGLGHDAAANMAVGDDGLFKGIVTKNDDGDATRHAVLINRDKKIFRRYRGKTPWRIKNGVYTSGTFEKVIRKRKEWHRKVYASIPKPDPLVKARVLKGALADVDPDVRAAAAVEILMTRLPKDKAARAEVMGIKKGVIAVLRDPSRNGSAKGSDYFFLVQKGGISTAHVVRDLLNYNVQFSLKEKQTKQAHAAIKMIGDATLPALLDSIRRGGFMGKKAAFALNMLNRQEAVPALLEELRFSGPSGQRAAEALSRNPHAYPAVESLFIRSQGRKCGATKAMAAMGTIAAPQLIKLLGHESPSVRRSAAYALGKMTDPYVDDKAIAKALTRTTLHDDDAHVRAYAQWALDRRDGIVEERISRFAGSDMCRAPWRYILGEGVHPRFPQ